jgi:hypothetical protein
MRRISGVLFLCLLLGTKLFAVSKPLGVDLTIKVIRSETSPVAVENPNTGACDQANYSAYCKFSATNFVQSRMVVEGADRVFNIACTATDKYSNCVSLPVGDTFQAHLNKKGLLITYRGADGKTHTQLYNVLYAGATLKPTAGDAESGIAPASGGESSGTPVQAPTADHAETAKPNLPAVAQTATAAVKVRCKFTSLPSGAEITLDGAYVGSTPSVIDVDAGTHQVEMSLPGYAPWRRKVDVLSGSELSISATLQSAK